MSAKNPPISEGDIRDWVGPTSFQRGRAYFEQGAIQTPRRQGSVIKANCRGSYAPLYRVEVAFGENGILWANCSCPVGSGGHCKHVAAMLLAWQDSVNVFMEIESHDAVLERRSKAELIALIQQMLNREPDLEILLELPRPGSDADQSPIDPDRLREQVARAFQGYENNRGWLDLTAVDRELDTFIDLAEGYLGLERVLEATTIYQIVSETILAHEELVLGDDTGLLGWRLNECVEGLGQCLDFDEESDRRQSILRGLMEIYFWDLDMGGIGLGDQVPGLLLDHASLQEREMVAGWITLSLEKASEWSRSILGGFLLDLQAEALDDEAYLALCRRTGRRYDLIARLLKMSRVEEATTEASQTYDYELLALADLFVNYGYKKIAEGLIKERIDTSHGLSFIDWLIDFHKTEGNIEQALVLAEERFWQRPTVNSYNELSTLATTLKRWPRLRSEILDRLVRADMHSVRVAIFVEEGEIDEALEALEQVKQPEHHWEYDSHRLALSVAKAAEIKRPTAAIQLYLQEAERLIDRRGRGNYRAAGLYLLKVREIFQLLEDSQGWKTMIGDLRERHRQLPALQDELNKAGL